MNRHRVAAKRRMLTPSAAGRYLGGDEDPVAALTLAKWRCAGVGPPFHKLGDARNAPVRYAVEDLDRYLAVRRRGAG